MAYSEAVLGRTEREQCSVSGPPAGIASEGRQEGEEDEGRRWGQGSEDSTRTAAVLGSLCVACGPMRQRCHSWEQELGWGLLHPRPRADPSCQHRCQRVKT